MRASAASRSIGSTVRRSFALLSAGACLLLASGAAAAVVGTFTATVTPAAVKPLTSASYTLTLTTSQTTARADRARIAAPPGFSIGTAPIVATTSATQEDGCDEASWAPSVTSDRITVRAPGGSSTRLCPGRTLTVSFSATSPAAEDTYTFVVELFRGEGDDEDTFTLTGPEPDVRVDGTPPSVAITQTPSNPSNSRSASFSFAASESAAAQCRLDGGAPSPCTSPVSYGDLGDGPHTFSVTATDPAGNTGEASHSWTVDTRAPILTVTSRPPALTNSRSATFAFSADEPSSLHCQLDGGGFLPCGSPASYHGLGDGTHTFAVRPTDAAGNTGATASYTWRIDGTAPETTLVSKPRVRTTLSSATFRFATSEDGSFQCQLDARAFTACTSPKTYTRLPRGTHTFSVQAVDAAGNIDATPATHRWTVGSARTVARSALFAPAAGARVTRPPLLRWRAVRRATYYNVQLYRAGRKVLTAWPTRTQLRLRTQWRYNGKAERLRPGLYRWYVWPGYGRAADRRYGRLLGTSTFVVPRTTSTR